MTEIRLEDVNAAITEHGYLPLSGAQLADLKAVAGSGLFGWILDCARHGRGSGSWEQLRDALYGASLHCESTLVALGIRVPRQGAIRSMLGQGRQLRIALARAAAQLDRKQEVSSGALEFIRQGFGLPATRPAAPKPLADGKPAGDRKPDQAQLHHVYGRAYAITFEATTSVKGQHALQVEAAARSARGGGFDWTQKIALQMVDHEIVELLAVLRGVRAEATFTNHGANRDKSLTVREQAGDPPSIYFNVRQAKDSRTVPVPVFNAFRIEALATRVLLANEPGLTASEVSQRIDRLAARYAVAR